MSSTTAIFMFLGIFLTATNAAPYSKYGRSCKDIGCRSNEVCVMAEDPCSIYSRDSCGRYPTCQLSSTGGESCTTKVCPSGQYCKTENGRPTCVNTTPALAYESAGVSSVNGQRTPTNEQPRVPADPPTGSRNTNSNPYAPSAPAAEDLDHNSNYPSFGNNNPAYPPYPGQNINTNNNAGHPPYPTHDNNYGYPPYPSHNNNNNNNYGYPAYPPQPNNNNNRPGVLVDRYGYPLYPPPKPAQPGNRNYNTYPQHNLPQHNPGWSNTYPNSIFRRNGASVFNASGVLLIGSFILSVLSLRI